MRHAHLDGAVNVGGRVPSHPTFRNLAFGFRVRAVGFRFIGVCY